MNYVTLFSISLIVYVYHNSKTIPKQLLIACSFEKRSCFFQSNHCLLTSEVNQ